MQPLITVQYLGNPNTHLWKSNAMPSSTLTAQLPRVEASYNLSDVLFKQHSTLSQGNPPAFKWKFQGPLTTNIGRTVILHDVQCNLVDKEGNHKTSLWGVTLIIAGIALSIFALGLAPFNPMFSLIAGGAAALCLLTGATLIYSAQYVKNLPNAALSLGGF